MNGKLPIINEKNIDTVIRLYKSGVNLKEISKEIGCSIPTVGRHLKQNGIKLRSYSDYKWNPTEEEKKKILHLYINEKRGIQFIAAELNTGWDNIKHFLIGNKVHFWTRSELIKSNMDFYGLAKNFTFKGHTHSQKSSKKISNSLKGNANRTVTGSKSQFILTAIGKVQGSYEVAYLQDLIKRGVDLPEIGGKVQTPYGLYFPDFQFRDRFIEVKSKFTWDVCNGIEPNPKGVKTDIQRKKIDWTSKNIKPVEIVILETKQALDLFREAINNEQLVTEKVMYKNGKYSKIFVS